MKMIVVIVLFTIGTGCMSDAVNCSQSHLDICSNEEGPYCTLGFKFGDQPSFSPAGLSVDGPGISALSITYSLRTDEVKVDTEFEQNIATFSFDKEPACKVEGIERALKEWSNFAAISFLQIADNSEADIEFFIFDEASISRGTPNYQEEPCKEFGGRVLFTNNFLGDCNQFRILALHEIGHALGLGHVNSDNIMTSSERKFQFDGLMLGDIQGIQSIYGAK